MPYLMTTLLAIALAAFQVHALQQANTQGLCNSPTIVNNATIYVGSSQVQMTTFTCEGGGPVHSRTAPRNACGEICTAACFDTGPVPAPSDCEMIVDAINIMSESDEVGPTFLLDPTNGYYLQLNFATCETYIGVSAEMPLEECWSDFAQNIGHLTTACFPASEYAACTSFPPDITYADWSMGVRHS